MIGKLPGLLAKEEMAFGGPDTFVLHDAAKGVPKKYLRPIFRLPGRDRILVQETGSMGKSAFIAREGVIDGTLYHYLQWKGVGTHAMNEHFAEDTQAFGGKLFYPLGEETLAPLYFVKYKAKKMLRLRGAAFYEDLLAEAQASQKCIKFGVRMPKVVATLKFTRNFSLIHSLPLPVDDNPRHLSGEKLSEFLQKHKKEVPKQRFSQLLEAKELAEPYVSAITGQNIRAFRNVWRVSDVEHLLKDAYGRGVKEALREILHLSASILSQETGESADMNTFMTSFADLMGRQAGILFTQKLFHPGLLRHKQDITLAAEICDVDEGVVGEPSQEDLVRQTLALLECAKLLARAVNLLQKKKLSELETCYTFFNAFFGQQ